MEAYVRALKIKRQVEERFLHIEGIHGLSIGYENLKVGFSNELCIYFHVHDTYPLKLGFIPKSIMGVQTRIMETEIPQPLHSVEFNSYTEPNRVKSSGNISGTINPVAIDKKTGEKVALTCQHLLKDQDDILNRTMYPAHMRADMYIRSALSDKVDAAIIIPDRLKLGNALVDVGQISGTYAVSIMDTKFGGYPIRKRGARTGLTFGVVKHLHYSGYRCDGWKFNDQLWIEGDEAIFSNTGDSGSVYMDVHNRIIGLHWGNEGSQNGIGSPIENVIIELNIEIPTTTLLPSGSERENHATISDFLN